jgi:hypothetical protein
MELSPNPSMTKCRFDWDAIVGSFKLKCPNEDRVRLIMSDKLSVAVSSLALKAGNFNLQVATSESEF